MILPTPGPLDYTRLFGAATPPDGAGPIGENGAWPQAIEVSTKQVLQGLNPLQHLPVIGMVYRAATGETIPTTMRVAGAGLIGGPLGMIGAALMSLFEEIVRMGPDLSRPSVPAGMSQTGSEAGVEPITPGTLTDGAIPPWQPRPPSSSTAPPTPPSSRTALPPTRARLSSISAAS